MMKGTGLGYGNLPTDRELTKEAFRLIAASESRKALREAEEQAKENALREARRLRNGAAKKNLEGKVVAEDDGGNVTRNRGNVCNLASKYPTHIKGVDATARSMATPEREAYCADRDEHRILRNIAEAKKRAGRRASAVDEATMRRVPYYAKEFEKREAERRARKEAKRNENEKEASE